MNTTAVFKKFTNEMITAEIAEAIEENLIEFFGLLNNWERIAGGGDENNMS